MCEVTRNFKLCTCSTGGAVHNKNSRRYENYIKQDNPNKIVWTLYKYEGIQYSGMDGMLIAPADKLDETFTAEYVKNELNRRNCFDFDYIPNEGDYLVLRVYQPGKGYSSEGYKYLPFIYSAGQWTINSYNAFYEKIIEIENGKISLE